MSARLPIPLTLGKKTKERKQEDEEVEEPLVQLGEDQAPSDPVEGDGETNDTSQQSEHTTASRDPPEEDEDDMTLEEHALLVVAILKPVTLTMLIVVLIVFALHMADKPSASYDSNLSSHDLKILITTYLPS